MKIIKKTYPLLLLLLLTACSSTPSHNEEEKTKRTNCFSKLDTLVLNDVETIGCSSKWVYQFVDDTTAVAISFGNFFSPALEEECQVYDLAKDTALVKLVVYEFMGVKPGDLIQMPLCTDILISNAIAPLERSPKIENGKITILKNSNCHLSFVVNVKLATEDKLAEKLKVVTAWNIEFCRVPG